MRCQRPSGIAVNSSLFAALCHRRVWCMMRHSPNTVIVVGVHMYDTHADTIYPTKQRNIRIGFYRSIKTYDENSRLHQGSRRFESLIANL